jgi:hypothetical protein
MVHSNGEKALIINFRNYLAKQSVINNIRQRNF